MSFIPYGVLGQNVEHQGGATFRQGLGIPTSVGNDPPLFSDSATQIRYNEDDKVIQYWENGNAEWKSLASTDEVNSGSIIVEDYATMMIIVNSAISGNSQKPLSILVLEDEDKNKENTIYKFFPNTPASESILKYIPSEEELPNQQAKVYRLAKGCLLGDSITGQHKTFTGGIQNTGAQGFWNWGNWFLGAPYDFSQNLGVSGDYSINIFSRIWQINPDIDAVFILTGINDLLAFSSSSNAGQITAEINRLIGASGVFTLGLTKLKEMGKKVAICTIPPNSAFNNASDARIPVLDAVNAWILTTPTLGLSDAAVDLFTALWDTTQPTIRVFKTNYSYDGTHLTNRGGFAGGLLCKAAIEEIYYKANSVSYKYDGFNNQISQISQFRTVPGVASTISYGSGVLASGWRSLNSGSGTPTLVLSQVNYTPNSNYIGPAKIAVGQDEKWQKLVITNAVSGSTIRLQLQAANVLPNNGIPGISAGDIFFATVEVLVENPVNLNEILLKSQCSFVNGTAPVDQSYSSSSTEVRSIAGISSNAQTDYAFESGFRAILATDPVRVPENISSATPITANIQLDAVFNGVGSADVYYARACYWRKQF